MAEFSHFFGIRPWEWDLLQYEDTVNLIAQVDAIRKEAKD